MIKKPIIIVFMLNIFVNNVCANEYKYLGHIKKEVEYQNAWCAENNGIKEFENQDKTRVDCLTSTHAVEFDFANKWAEGIGQALHYQLMTGKRAKVILIIENPIKQMVYFKRVKALAEKHDFDAEYITPKILRVGERSKIIGFKWRR